MVDLLRINHREDISNSESKGIVELGDSDIKRLVREAVEGSVDAFGNLYELYFNRLFRYAYYHLRNKMAAEDAVEDVFIKAWKAIKTCKGKERTFGAWLYRITHNHVMDILRRKREHVSLENVDLISINNGQCDLEIKQEYRALQGRISELPEQQRQVIILKFIEGMENVEIGQIMGKSQGAVRILQMRALAKLRKNANGKQDNGT